MEPKELTLADASATDREEPSKAAPKKRLRALRVALRVVLGLAIGALIGEAVFRSRDDGAFPLVNVYAPDPRCGVRLLPGSTTRVALDGRAATTIHINGDGFRGPDWPARTDNDVLIVGDSQSFGLGVEEGDTLRAKLTAGFAEVGQRGSVIDASVPTYGPIEYAITLSRLTAERRPQTVVLAINVSNDFFELDRPNRDRHAALDGWAVRREAGLSSVRSSPVIETAIQHSHMAFALWKWTRTKELSASASTPERDFHDLANSVIDVEQSYDQSAKDREAERQKSISDARVERDRASRGVIDMVRKYTPLVAYSGAMGDEWRAYVEEKGAPNEHIFTIDFGGCEREPGEPYSYEGRFTGDQIRDDVESLLRDFIDLPTLSRAESNRLRDAFIRRDDAIRTLEKALVPPPPLPNAHPAEAMTRWISTVRDEAPEARIVVLPIPMDVQVSPDARARRSATEPEALALDRLVSDLVTSSREAGVRAIDPTNDLRALGDAAYLSDGHLSAQGQAALAQSVTAALTH